MPRPSDDGFGESLSVFIVMHYFAVEFKMTCGEYQTTRVGGMNVKKIFIAVFCTLLFALPLFAAEGEVEPIKIGAVLTITGDLAHFGQADDHALRLAAEEINEAGGILGRPVKLIIYDCGTRVDEMIQLSRRLVEQDKVCAVIGPTGSDFHIAAAPIFEKAGVPHIANMATNPSVTVDDEGNTRPYNFRICFIDSYAGRVAADFVYGDLGKRKAAILYDLSSKYSYGLREYFAQAFEELGGEVVADESYRAEDIDFRAQLAKIKASSADVLYLPVNGNSPPLVMKQAREAGIEIPFVGGDGYSELWWNIGDKSIEGSYWVTHAAKDAPELQAFYRKYEDRFKAKGRESRDAVLTYDVLYWIKNAIERAGGDDPAKVRDALEATRDLKLLHATITMDELHNPRNKNCFILIAKDGQAATYKRINGNP